jgi:hypothetical protein
MRIVAITFLAIHFMATPPHYHSISDNSEVSSNFFTYYGTFATALYPTLHQKITSTVLKTRLHRD